MARTPGPAAVLVRVAGRSAVVWSTVQQPAGPGPAERQAGAGTVRQLPARAVFRFRVIQGRRQRHGVQCLQQATAVSAHRTT